MNNNREWHDINHKLTEFLGICDCQRKLKSIVDILITIRDSLNTGRKLTPEQLFICALLDGKAFSHGINAEYPIITEIQFWDWLDNIKNDSNLEDN